MIGGGPMADAANAKERTRGTARTSAAIEPGAVKEAAP
jgi:hypothetical protein